MFNFNGLGPRSGLRIGPGCVAALKRGLKTLPIPVKILTMLSVVVQNSLSTVIQISFSSRPHFIRVKVLVVFIQELSSIISLSFKIIYFILTCDIVEHTGCTLYRYGKGPLPVLFVI